MRVWWWWRQKVDGGGGEGGLVEGSGRRGGQELTGRTPLVAAPSGSGCSRRWSDPAGGNK